MLQRIVDEKNGRWLRFTALQTLSELNKTEALKSYFEERLKQDKDPMFQTLIQRYLAEN